MPYKDLEKELAYRKEYNQRPEVKERHNEREKFLYHSDPKVRERNKEYCRRGNKKLRADAIAVYGNICACCGESNISFLCIDHINGGGNIHRKGLNSKGGTSFYRWLKINNWPEGFQVLCYNCNMAKGTQGICPHEINKRIN